MAKVFLSYSRGDLVAARKVAKALEAAGHSVWWDRNIRGGAQFSKEIDEALAAAEAVVVLWSASAIESAWVRDEAAAGRDAGRLVPARIDDCTPPLGFRQFQTIELAAIGKRGAQASLAQLSNAVRAVAEIDPAGVRMAEDAPSRRFSRRGVIAGVGTAAVLASAGGAYWISRSSPPPVPREVEPLMRQAKQLMDQNTREGQNQAIGLYQRVVETAPGYADGWGWLGFAHGVVSHYRPRSQALGHKARAEAAGRRALELDPRSAYGELALSVALPFVGHWAEREQRLRRALATRPKDDQILLMLAVALQFAGRSTEAVPLYQQINERPLTPASYTNYIRALWSAGRLAELDQAIQDATSLYPTQGSLWFTRVNIAIYAGQADTAASLAQDVQSRPTGVSDTQAEELVNLARTIQSRDPGEINRLMVKEKAEAKLSANGAEVAIRNASALGRLDDAFTLSEAYYFGRPFAVPDYPDQDGHSPEQRQTRWLFEPVTRPMRQDSRFEPLMKELGFDRYWRASGKLPDYRHIPGL